MGQKVEPPYAVPPHGTCRVQVVRSVSDWSHGVLTEHSIQNACQYFLTCPCPELGSYSLLLDIQLILEANHHIYIGLFCFFFSFLNLLLLRFTSLVRESILVSFGFEREGGAHSLVLDDF
jgi:hypothetical protein